MAQLYKMTLYICDLEEDLSLQEIKTLIEERALNGVAVNCICHFADEQIGKYAEWNDDIDINRIDCPTELWEKYFNEQNDYISIEEQVQEYLSTPNTRVYIKYNNELNYNEWMYSVVVENSNDFWLCSFDTREEAEKYVLDNKLKKVGE